jgi:large subunit ribosomal protein L17
MRHGKTINHLGRTSSHRKAMLSNMASSLILHKRITTTLAKAKALRSYVEPLLTKSKNDSTHSRRMVFSYLGNKESVKELFGVVADKVAARPGGYTRIIKLPNRVGDNAEMSIIELVDFNETLLAAKEAPEKSKTRRSRRSGSSVSSGASSFDDATVVASSVAEDVVADDVVAADVESTEMSDDNADVSVESSENNEAAEDTDSEEKKTEE